ncbi:MAG: preprotein translocase subunit SecE [Clostridiales bacterium]|nr:preprotein translocase subunit SecE [Clostridiales bacterium]
MENKKDTVVSTKTAEKKVKKDKKPNVFVRAWGKIKEVFSELKKVTWPTFPTVMKQLGCVLVTVAVVLVIIMIMDLGLQELLKLVRGV